MTPRNREVALQRLSAQVTADAAFIKQGPQEITPDQYVIGALTQGRRVTADDLGKVHAQVIGLDITVKANQASKIDPSGAKAALTSAVSAAFDIKRRMGPAYEATGGKNPTEYLPLLQDHGIDISAFQPDLKNPKGTITGGNGSGGVLVGRG